jgi:hypothetical protein
VKRRWLIISFVAGAVLGIAIGFVGGQRRQPDRPTFVLKEDLDVGRAFFFEDRTAPVKGTIAAGSTFEVELRYSNADYIAFRTVVDRDELMRISKSVPVRKQ